MSANLTSSHDLFQGKGAFIFQQDSAPCLCAVFLCGEKRREGNHSARLEWPGNSPDVNLIENLWILSLIGSKPGIKTQLIEAIFQSTGEINELKTWFTLWEGVLRP